MRARSVSWLRRAVGWIFLPLVLGALFLVQRGNVKSFVVGSESMEPTLLVGDKWLMEPPPGGLYATDDIVVFERPEEAGFDLVKRIVAMTGDEVATRHGYLYVNGQPSPPPTGRDASIDVPNRTWRLAEGQVFLAGDNRANSTDSRDYGPVETSRLKGIIKHKMGL